jgi:hypothetical protein
MFEWLEQEVSMIRTPKFHSVEGAVDLKMKEAVMQSRFPLPNGYKEFVLSFGNVKLYREAGRDSYRIGVFAAPRKLRSNGESFIYQIGFHDGAMVYVKESPEDQQVPIFEREVGPEEKVADSFEEWLRQSCAEARDAYGREKWAEILRGPAPFTDEEQQIIEARRQITWRILGIDRDGDHIFEVSNNANRRLRVLTIGARSKDRRLNGAIRLNIEDIPPGQAAILRAGCYKDLIPPQEIEVFSLPDPCPEDRELYQELLI